VSLEAVHAFATLAMVGLIWFVQIVHYPLMRRVGAREFVGYEREHTRRTAWVVGPAMLAEAGSAALLLGQRQNAVTIAGAILLAVIWLSTALVQVPLHRTLSIARDEAALKRLVQSNWVRTLAWSARGVLALALMMP
jgi:hypothetical protein